MGPVREGAGALRPVGALPAAETPQAAGFVEPGLLALGAEEATCPELAQDTRALHSGLKPLEKTFRVLSFPKRDECQCDLLSAPDGHIKIRNANRASISHRAASRRGRPLAWIGRGCGVNHIAVAGVVESNSEVE